MKDNPWKKILINTGSLSLIQALGDFSGLVLYVVLSRYFGPEGIGLYAFGYSIALIAFFIIVFGFDDYGIRECTLIDFPARQKLLGNIVSIQFILLAVILVLVSLFVLITSPASESIIVIYSMLFYLIALAFSRIFFIPSNSQEKMIVPAMAELLVKFLSVFLASISIIFFAIPIHLALLTYPVCGILIIFISYRSLIKINTNLKLNFKPAELIALVRTVWPFSASLMIHPVYTRAGLITLTFMLGNSAAGLYAPSQKFVEVGLMPVIFFCFSMYPIMSKYFVYDKMKFQDSAEKYFRAVLIFASLLMWILYFIVPMVIIPLFGTKFVNSVIIVKYFSILIFIFSLTKGLHKLLLAANLQVDRIKYESIVLLLNVILNIVLIPSYGIPGAVFALIISETSLVVFFIFVISRKSELLYRRVRTALKEFFLSFTLTLIAAIILTYNFSSGYFVMISTFILFVIAGFSTGFLKKFDIQSLRTS